MTDNIKAKSDELVDKFSRRLMHLPKDKRIGLAVTLSIIALEEIIKAFNNLLNKAGYVAEGDRIITEIEKQNEILDHLKSKL